MNKLLAATATDPEAEAGAWFEFKAGEATFRIKLARAGSSNNDYLRSQAKHTKHIRSTSKLEALDIVADRKITRKIFAESVVKGWNEEDVGEAFSPEAAHDMMAASADFHDWCVTTAFDANNYRKVVIEEHAGN